MKIIKEELRFEENLKKRLEFICEFSKVTPTFINGSIRVGILFIKKVFSLYKQALNLGTCQIGVSKFYAIGLIPNPIKKILIGGNLDMNNFREVNDDLLKDWLEFRDQTVLAYTTNEDKKHTIEFNEICKKSSLVQLQFISEP